MAEIEITETEDVLIIDAPNHRFGFQPNTILHVTDFFVDDCARGSRGMNTPAPKYPFDIGEK